MIGKLPKFLNAINHRMAVIFFKLFLKKFKISKQHVGATNSPSPPPTGIHRMARMLPKPLAQCSVTSAKTAVGVFPAAALLAAIGRYPVPRSRIARSG